MNYTLRHAYSLSNSLRLDLCKDGNKYTVILWDAQQHRTRWKCSFHSLLSAEEMFDSLRSEFNLEMLTEPDTSEALAYIESQHD